ncbi:hypothetical protein ANCDUO_02343 [Ancylostoma duodenale]|uniref:Uncharacterized protein n=1 Tax=Ancylostoma duodenale TaxID=51022 RepID=A0A0C2DWM5_9BILA|nr:hypothetical protein ANCDUO_02343 [Ancylostoma duodenale]
MDTTRRLLLPPLRPPSPTSANKDTSSSRTSCDTLWMQNGMIFACNQAVSEKTAMGTRSGILLLMTGLLIKFVLLILILVLFSGMHPDA